MTQNALPDPASAPLSGRAAESASATGEPPLKGGALTRARILDAAARLMRTAGLTRTTTKEIAREAGCSEATLYKHFRDKEDIFVRVLRERVPSFVDLLAGLPEQAGEGSVVEHLEDVARRGVLFYREMVPMAGALLASPELLAAHLAKLDPEVGPQMPTRSLAAYLRAEQRRGRMAASVDADAAAALLVGACFHRAFLEVFFAQDTRADLLPLGGLEDFARQTVQALWQGCGTEL
jgi:AcrR family transcriptional regulator